MGKKLERLFGIGTIYTREKDYGGGNIAHWDSYVCPRCNTGNRFQYFKCPTCNKRVYFWKDEREK